MMILPLLLMLQTTPVRPLPPANLPAPDFETAAVLAPIDRLLAGVAARNAATMAAQARSDGRVTAVMERPDGTRTVRVQSWAEFTAGLKTGPERFEERQAMPAVEIDGDIAMVWAPYSFLVDGKVSHCGVNHFDLVREGGAWKILNATWSHRTIGCAA